MSEHHPPLAPAAGPLAASMDPRRVFDRLAESRFRFVQLDAALPGMRPRELDRSARRDLVATLRRRELRIAGVDLWIPLEHFRSPAQVDRAATVAREAIELAADLERCPVSLTLPPVGEDGSDEVVAELAAHAERLGVQLADHSPPLGQRSSVGVGVDPATLLAAEEDPAQAILAHAGSLAGLRLSDMMRSGHRGPLDDSGEGRLDLRSYLAAIAAVAWDQPVVVDLRQCPEPWAALDRSAGIWNTRL